MNIQENIQKLIGNQNSVKDKLNEKKGLERYIEDFKLLVSLLNDYRKGNYRNIPLKTLAATIAGILYAINPIDIIPDSLPIIGAIDDAVVIGFCLKMMESDLVKYKAWKEAQQNAEDTTAEPVNPA